MEDFTTYTEVDPNGRVVPAAARVTWTALTTNERALVYEDKGAGFFSGDFEHKFEFLLDAAQASTFVNFWALANLVDDLAAINAAGGDALTLSSNGFNGLLLTESVGGSQKTDTGAIVIDTLYFATMTRDESIGANGQLKLVYRTGSHEGTVIDTLTKDLREKENFRYVYGLMSWKAGINNVATGYTQNLDLGLDEPEEPGATGYHNYRLHRDGIGGRPRR